MGCNLYLVGLRITITELFSSMKILGNSLLTDIIIGKVNLVKMRDE